MKRFKKYPFLILVLISVLGYIGFKIPQLNPKEELVMETVSRGTDKSVSQVSAGEKAAGKASREKVQEKTSQVVNEPQKEPEPAVAQAQLQAPQTRSFQRVEMDYLNDALFIGDSRTSTLYEYAGWDNTDFFVKYGQTVWDVWDNTMNGKTLEQMLAERQYGKIYIMLGINELGRGTADSYGEQFKIVVDQVRQMEPDAVIFVQAIMHVTAGKDAENTYINNGEINARNERLKPLADNIKTFYIDVNEVMDQPGTGKLQAEYSFDGVHLQVKYLDIWREYLLDHGIL